MEVPVLSDKPTETLKHLVALGVGQSQGGLSHVSYWLSFTKEAEEDAEKKAALGNALVFVERARNALAAFDE